MLAERRAIQEKEDAARKKVEDAEALKVLGNGELAVKLMVQAAAFTASARAKIEAAGGSCDVPD